MSYFNAYSLVCAGPPGPTRRAQLAAGGRSVCGCCYIRYVDDFLLFGESKAKLAEMRCAVEDFLEALRLLVHERKSRVYRCADGVTFLGGGCFRKNRGWCGNTWSDSAGGCGTWSRRFEKAPRPGSRFEREFTR